MEHRPQAPNIEVSNIGDHRGNQCTAKSATALALGELPEAEPMGGPVNCTSSELSIYLLALGEGYLPTYYSDINPSVPSKSSPIASKSYTLGSKTVLFRGFPSLRMLSNSTESLGADGLTSFAEDSPAKTLAAQERERESAASDLDCGPRWLGSFARFDPVSHSWKTRQCLLLGGLESFSETWPRWGMMLSGECLVRLTPERPTSENESGFWVTPKKTEERGENYTLATSLKHHEEGRQIALSQQVRDARLWPTPCLPGNGGTNGKAKMKAMLFPTPLKHDAIMSGFSAESLIAGTDGGRMDGLCRVTAAEAHATGGQLNPQWVEWLMGWPIGWTDLQPLETAKFRKWLRSHSEH